MPIDLKHAAQEPLVLRDDLERKLCRLWVRKHALLWRYYRRKWGQVLYPPPEIADHLEAARFYRITLNADEFRHPRQSAR